MLVGGDQPLGHGERDRRLADSARPDDGDETALRQLRHERSDDVAAADHPRERRSQIVRGQDRGGRGSVSVWPRVSATGATKQ